MDNAALERRAREIVAQAYVAEGGCPEIAEAIRQDDQCLIKDSVAIRAVVSAITLATEMREACAKDGWVMVPREPTMAMLESVDDEAEDKYIARGRAISAWKSMIDAAPKAPGALPLPGEGDGGLERIAVDQNDAMRQELAHVGNLVSDLARVMRVDQANADGSWPDLAGRIMKLIAAAASPVDVEGLVEAVQELLLNADPDVSDTAIVVGNGASALLRKLRATIQQGEG